MEGDRRERYWVDRSYIRRKLDKGWKGGGMLKGGWIGMEFSLYAPSL